MKKRYVQDVTIIVLAVITLVTTLKFGTSVGADKSYAYQHNVWNLGFSNVTRTEKSTVETENVNGPVLTKTSTLRFDVTLFQGDTYEFTTELTNLGTIDARLASISLMDFARTDNVSYTVTYADGSAIKEEDSLPSGATKKILVTVSANDLLANYELHSFELNMNYYAE